MKEYLFRGKRVVDREWEYGCYVRRGSNIGAIVDTVMNLK